MQITWVVRGFLDYRIPVYAELDRLCGNQLTVIYYRDIVPERCRRKLEAVLGERAIDLDGELRLCGKMSSNAAFANSGIRIPLRPGLIQKVRSAHPDVMVSDGFMQWTYAPLWVRFWSGIPHVMCYERTEHTERKCQWYRTLYRKMVMHAIDSYCANGSLCGKYLQKLGVPELDISYGQMAADTQGLASAVSMISGDESKELRRNLAAFGTMFLYIGQIIPRKGIRQLLDAWKKFDDSSANLVLIGDGDEYEELMEWCRREKLSNVHWAGCHSYDEIAKFYRAADVFIIPTLEDNWSLVVPEAMACGLPIACSKYNGCYPELVKKENGWVFDPLDINNTVNSLRNIMTSKENLPRMGQASRDIVSHHTPSHAAEIIYEACQKAIEKRHTETK